MQAKIETINGNSVITVDKKPIPQMAYITYRPEFNRYGDFAKAGVRLFSVNLNFSEMPINERAPVLVFQKGIFEREEWDFGIVEKNLDEIFAVCPKAYIFPRVNINLPRSWEEAHPTELCDEGFGDRCRFSYASDAWAEKVEEYLTVLVKYIEGSKYADRILGYQLAAGNTEEWLAIDPNSGNGVRAREKFFRYCDSLGKERTESAYYSFMSDLVASRIIKLADTVKEITSGNKLVGCFYGYTLFVDRKECHNALKKVLESDSVDFLCSPLSYADLRKVGIDLYPMIPTASVLHHGKTYFSENDIRTHLSKPVHDHPNYTSPIWYGHEKELAAEQLKLAFCRAMLHGYGMWWFDMWGGWYDDTSYMELFSKMCRLCEEGTDTSDADVAVYVDEEAVVRQEEAQKFIRSAIRELGLISRSYDSYLSGDFEGTAKGYRACILIEPCVTELSWKCCRFAEEQGIPLIRIKDGVPSSEELDERLTSLGVEANANRPSVVYRGKRFISIYTAEGGIYDFNDGGRRNFTDVFDGEKICFPKELKKGKLYLFRRQEV